MFVRWKQSDRHIEVYKNRADQWTWRTVASNKQVTSNAAEDFASKSNAVRAAEAESKDTGREVVVEEF